MSDENKSICELFSQLYLTSKDDYIIVTQMNCNLFSFETKSVKYIVNKECINQIHYFDDIFDNFIPTQNTKIICPNIKNFDTAIDKLIVYCNYVTLYPQISREFEENFLRTDEEILIDILILSNFLNCSNLLKFLWMNLLDKKYFDNEKMHNYFVNYINSTHEDRLINKFDGMKF